MNLTEKDPRWIGAWWLGFVSISGLFFISGGLLLLFPKEMKSGRQKRLQALKKGELPSSDNSIQYTIKGYIMASIKICFNKVLMLAIAAVTIKMVYIIGLASFLIKILVVKFGVPSYKASMILGVRMIPTMICKLFYLIIFYYECNIRKLLNSSFLVDFLRAVKCWM